MQQPDQFVAPTLLLYLKIANGGVTPMDTIMGFQVGGGTFVKRPGDNLTLITID